MATYRTLEEALVGEGHLTRADLELVLAQRNGVRGGLGWHLVEGGRLTEEALAQTLADSITCRRWTWPPRRWRRES